MVGEIKISKEYREVLLQTLDTMKMFKDVLGSLRDQEKIDVEALEHRLDAKIEFLDKFIENYVE